MNPGPPPFLRQLLTQILPPGPVRDGLLGDLAELYGERVRNGRAGADPWYARQLISAAARYLIYLFACWREEYGEPERE